MRFLDVTLDALEDPAMQFATQPQVSGTEGGHTRSLQYLAQRGITLLGRLRDIEDGVFVTDLFGQGVNLVTGDYSRGASGLRIRNGELAGPVAEITIAGTLPEMFRALVPANDLAFERGIDVPTFRIDGMSVAGE